MDQNYLASSSSGHKKSLVSPMHSLEIRSAPNNNLKSLTLDVCYAALHFLAGSDFATSLDLASETKGVKNLGRPLRSKGKVLERSERFLLSSKKLLPHFWLQKCEEENYYG